MTSERWTIGYTTGDDGAEPAGLLVAWVDGAPVAAASRMYGTGHWVVVQLSGEHYSAAVSETSAREQLEALVSLALGQGTTRPPAVSGSDRLQ